MKVIYQEKEVELEDGANGFVAAKILDAEEKNKDIAIKSEGKLLDLRSPLHEGERIDFVKIGSPEAFEILNHSTSHLMAQALKRLYPDCQFGYGPAIEEGFYYDVDFGDKTITEADFPAIEAEMKRCAKENSPYLRSELNAEEARVKFHSNPYKQELINEHQEESLSCYQQGEFIDFCRGPHLPSTGMIKQPNTTRIFASSWKGSRRNENGSRPTGPIRPTSTGGSTRNWPTMPE